MITKSTPTLTLNCNLGNEKPTEVRRLISLETRDIFRKNNMQSVLSQRPEWVQGHNYGRGKY